MSILVRDMEMPTRCLDCKFMIGGIGNDDCILQSAEQNEKANTWDDLKANCPLIEVPPHGDLIDRDELIENKFANDISYKAFANLVKRQKAIIKSERSTT